MNLNSAELLLNWPLCVETPDGKCLFLSLSAMKTWALSLYTVSRMLRCALDCCCYWCTQTLMPGWHSYIVCTLSGCKATETQYRSISILYWGWQQKFPNVYVVNHTILIWCWIIAFHENIGNMSVDNQLKFQGLKNKVSIVYKWPDQELNLKSLVRVPHWPQL